MSVKGNREALLHAAKQCLLEKGYAQTTARDIASSAGVSLAAIGYHFASKEALLTEALLAAFEEWEQDLQAALRANIPPGVSPAQRFQAVWAHIIATFHTHQSLWTANLQIFVQMLNQPETRKLLTDRLQQARTGLAALFLDQEEATITPDTANTVGAFLHVLLSGLIVQSLLDSSSAITAPDLTRALQTIAATLQPETSARKTNPSKTSARKAITPKPKTTHKPAPHPKRKPSHK